MRMVKKFLKEGLVTVVPETLDDLWHLEKVVAPNDTVRGTTLRRIKGKEGQTGKDARIPIFIEIKVDSVELHKFSDTLRIKGKIVTGKPLDLIEINTHHTFEVKAQDRITIIKPHWQKNQLDRLKKAEAAVKKPKISLVALDDESASFGIVTQFELQLKGKVNSGIMGKQYKSKTKEQTNSYFEKVADIMKKMETDRIIVAGPGFTPEDFKKWLKNKEPVLLKKLLFEKISHAEEPGLKEIINRGIIEKAIGEDMLSQQTRLIEEAIKRITKHQKNVAYGEKEVKNALLQGAVQDLLITDTLLKENRDKTEKLFKQAEEQQAQIHIFDADYEAGKKLKGLTGLIALLRYNVE